MSHSTKKKMVSFRAMTLPTCNTIVSPSTSSPPYRCKAHPNPIFTRCFTLLPHLSQGYATNLTAYFVLHGFVYDPWRGYCASRLLPSGKSSWLQWNFINFTQREQRAQSLRSLLKRLLNCFYGRCLMTFGSLLKFFGPYNKLQLCFRN